MEPDSRKQNFISSDSRYCDLSRVLALVAVESNPGQSMTVRFRVTARPGAHVDERRRPLLKSCRYQRHARTSKQKKKTPEFK